MPPPFFMVRPFAGGALANLPRQARLQFFPQRGACGSSPGRPACSSFPSGALANLSRRGRLRTFPGGGACEPFPAGVLANLSRRGRLRTFPGGALAAFPRQARSPPFPAGRLRFFPRQARSRFLFLSPPRPPPPFWEKEGRSSEMEQSGVGSAPGQSSLPLSRMAETVK